MSVATAKHMIESPGDEFPRVSVIEAEAPSEELVVTFVHK
jgi:hypothetical protein